MQWIYDKKFITGNLVAIASLSIFSLFPSQSGVVGFIAVPAAFFLVLPLLFIRFIAHDRVSEYGFQWGEWKKNSLWTALPLTFFAGVVFLLSRYTTLLKEFSVPLAARSDFKIFLLYVSLLGVYLFFCQVFFCGFLLGVWRRMKAWLAILVQAFSFVAFLVVRSESKESIAIIGVYLLIATLSGLSAHRTKSLLPAFLFSYLSVILAIVASLVFS